MAGRIHRVRIMAIVWQRDIRGSAAVTVFLMRSSVWDFQKNSVMIRYRYNTHSVFVTKVTADTITFADCNWDGHCKIRWNVTIPKSSITGLTYIRHANNYDSVVKIPQTVKLTTAKNKATKKVWLKWNRSDKTSGYEVYRSTKKNSGYKKIKTINSAKNCSMTDKNRMIGKKYYYKIRAYRNVNGQRLYGSYSNIKSITIRK